MKVDDVKFWWTVQDLNRHIKLDVSRYLSNEEFDLTLWLSDVQAYVKSYKEVRTVYDLIHQMRLDILTGLESDGNKEFDEGKISAFNTAEVYLRLFFDRSYAKSFPDDKNIWKDLGLNPCDSHD
ncbi:hypothetical protein D2Q93_14735 [Alicyclobacillaceae bacterium I2511]|nr:hypothetical protein D2Q93_14735 [Alicyclobacillaceae bacterium I2511]